MLAAGLAACCPAVSPWLSASAQPPKARVIVHVSDENGLAVESAAVSAEAADSRETLRCETGFRGQCELYGRAGELYRFQVHKEGFYPIVAHEIRVEEFAELLFVLNHFQEYNEEVQVAESAHDIDLAETSNQRKLQQQDMLNLPYKTARDFRNVLPLLPGVLQDAEEKIHPAGAAAHQVASQMDGFSVSHAAGGFIEPRLSIGALRSVQLQTSRYSAEYGRGSGGILALETGMGDDRYRFSATNFVPSVQYKKGLSFDKWTPRAVFSGPLKKGKIWFFQSADADYSRDDFPDLPADANQTTAWRANSLTKAQVNWNRSNILTGSFLFNRRHVDHLGLSGLHPLETTIDLHENLKMVTLKNQTALRRELLLELGWATGLSDNRKMPLAKVPYALFPGGSSGSYFETADTRTRRSQGLAHLHLPLWHWKGSHQWELGGDLQRLHYRGRFTREPILFLRTDGSRVRKAVFSGGAPFEVTNTEFSFFAQDRWTLSRRTMTELGLRADRDRLTGRLSVHPRWALTFLLHPEGGTKISFGAGLYRDATRLDLAAQPFSGNRVDRFFGADGQTPAGPPVVSVFQADTGTLATPRTLNWSLGLEQKLPSSFFLRTEFMQKRGRNGLTYVPRDDAPPPGTSVRYDLRSLSSQNYDALEISARRTFKSNYLLMLSYTRSAVRSNTVHEFSPGNPVIGRQFSGPLPWDAPNRFLSWGWFPLPRKLDLAFSFEWRDGFPYYSVNQAQQLTATRSTERYPWFLNLNIHVERRFQWRKFQWALRLGGNDLTNRKNPTDIDNNVDSPYYRTCSGLQHRTFTARIRLLGRK